MSQPWAASIPATLSANVALLRLLRDVSVLGKSDCIWLRGNNYDDVDASLRSLMGAQRFFVLPNLDLVPVGCSVPTDRLPDGNWEPIAEYFSLTLPPAMLAGKLSENSRVPLTLVRLKSSSEDPAAITPNMLMLDFQVWHDYVVHAPNIRLRQTSFAVTEAYTLVRGVPTPPLPGVHYQLDQSVALPIGWEWSLNVDRAAAHRALGLAPNEIGVFHSDGTWSKLRETDFVVTTRSAARRTKSVITL